MAISPPFTIRLKTIPPGGVRSIEIAKEIPDFRQYGPPDFVNVDNDSNTQLTFRFVSGEGEFNIPANTTRGDIGPVSYTHLTLPTICSV